MGTWIGLEAIPEIPFPGTYAYDTAFPIMIHFPEKCKKHISGTFCRGIGNGGISMFTVFTKDSE